MSTQPFNSDGGFTTPGNIDFTNNAAIQLTSVAGVTIYGNSIDQATALTLNNSGDAALWANANVTINSDSQGSNPQWIFGADGNLTTPSGSGDITGANLISAVAFSATGNITGNYFIGNGSQLTGIAASYGNSNVATFLAAYGSNTISTTGSITSGNITGGNVLTAGVVSVTGNITAGNIINTGISSVTGNITGGNVLTAGQVSATGNVTGSNLNTAGQVSATGNATFNAVSLSGNVTSSGLTVFGSAIISGNATVQGTLTYNNLTNITTPNLVFGLANTSTGISANGAGFVVGNTSQASFLYNYGTTAWNSNIAISAVGNLTGGNVLTGGIVSATGNITGGNVLTAGVMSSTGNATHGNVLTGGVISATGNITGSNISATNHTGTTVSVTGNVTAGNVINTGISSVTGNITAGNVLTGGVVSATGNITTANSFVGNLAGTTVSATGNVYTNNIIANNVIINGQSTTYGTVTPAYMVVGLASSVSGFGSGSTVIFDTVVGNTNSQTSYNASTGVFTLTAGVAYDMSFTPSFITFTNPTTGYLCYQWVDATTNTPLDSTGTGMGTGISSQDTTAQQDNATARVIYTPSTNQTVKLLVTSGNGTVTLRGSIGTQAVIKPLNPAIAVQAANPVGFRATTPVTNVSVNNGASATMLFGTEEVDTNSVYNPATGRFTPNIAGYYSVDWFIVTSANGANELLVTLNKNGTDIAWSTNVTTATAHWNGVGGSAGMIYFNGTTDYILVKLTNNSGSTATVYSGSLSYFSAYLIR
jgi:hypothetical protein